MNKHTVFVAILTLTILFHLSVVLDDGEHLGENHRKLAIPAEYLRRPIREIAFGYGATHKDSAVRVV